MGPQNYKAKAMATQLKPCAVAACKFVTKYRLCSGPHYLNKCKHFCKLKFDDRRKFETNEGLCRCSLEPGHFTKECRRESLCCQKPGSVRRHTTLLHPPESTVTADSEERVET